MCISKINNENNNRKRKILLSTLIPSSVIIIALVIFLGCFFGCKINSIFTLKDDKSVTEYLNKHRSVHTKPQQFKKDNLTQGNRQYLHDNLNGQNLLNGMIATHFSMNSFNSRVYASTTKWETKHGRNWGSIKLLNDDALNEQYAKNIDTYVKCSINNLGVHVYFEYGPVDNKAHCDLDWNFLNESFVAPCFDENGPSETPTCGFINFCVNPNFPSPANHMAIWGGAFGIDYPGLSKIDYPKCEVID